MDLTFQRCEELEWETPAVAAFRPRCAQHRTPSGVGAGHSLGGTLPLLGLRWNVQKSGREPSGSTEEVNLLAVQSQRHRPGR